jgi:hypothetical protein
MAGEWLMYDVCLPQKPEVLELVDRTGLDTDQVVGRMLMLWGWASLNCEEGQARISVRLLARAVGGDEAFWRAVESVGWLEIDAEAGTVAIPGWDRRFSNAAKSRALHTARNQRANAQKDGETRPARNATRAARTSTRAARAPNAPGASKRREREERISSSSSPPSAAPGDQAPDPGPAGWETLRTAWREGKGRPWQLPAPPEQLEDRLAEEGWFQKALAAIGHLPRCRYFRDPVTLPQFVGPGFVDKILGGQFDNAREPRGPTMPGDRPPAKGWDPDDEARLEATRRRLAEQLREAS